MLAFIAVTKAAFWLHSASSLWCFHAHERAASADREWRSSKLVGVDVYDDANDKVGEIEELIVDKYGKIEKAILGIGGFLGMGEHYVAVSFDKLKWVNEPVKISGAAAADKKKKTVAVIAVTITKCKRNGPIGAIFRSRASESLVALS